MCNSSCIQPKNGFLAGLRELCDQYGIALIFDEVITGFRTSLGGAQKFYNVVPDISIFGKALASGYPISAVVGKLHWMELIAEGKVIHAGTMNAGNPSVAAATATLDILAREGTHERIFGLGKRLMAGLRDAAKETGANLLVQGPGPMLHTGFTNIAQVDEFRDMKYYDKAKLNAFVAGLHNRGIRIIGRGLWYISAVHTADEIDHAIAMSRDTLREMN
jgi:glutamate-1-semialdehyde 2,1-aminomutase